MDLKDLWKQLTERFSSPLIFSFILSWLVINWDVTIGLLWLSPSEIRSQEGLSLLEFIRRNVSMSSGIWFPLISASVYTFAAPVLKNLIRAFYTWTRTWGDDWHLSISKEGKVPIAKYLNIRKAYTERTKVLEDAISTESSTQSELESTKTELLKARERINEVGAERQSLQSHVVAFSNTQLIQGKWINDFKDASSRGDKEEVEIEGDKYYITSPPSSRRHVFRIESFSYDPNTKRVFFVKNRISQKEYWQNGTPKYLINQLELKDDGSMVGKENGTIDILYRRIGTPSQGLVQD